MNEPYWILSAEGGNYDALNEDISTDYLIIGGGLTGVTCLYMLTKAGLQATLIDAGKIGYGTTGRNTGKATAQHGICPPICLRRSPIAKTLLKKSLRSTRG